MPFEIRKSGDGYKVFKKDSSKAFSKKALSKEQAEKQLAAMHANISEDFLKRIDEALGLKSVSKGPASGPSKGLSGSDDVDTPSISKKKKEKAIKIEDEVLESG